MSTHNWEKCILKHDDIIELAVKLLDSESSRIVLVVNKNEQLVGTITDGDVRRGLIRHVSLKAKLSEIMYKSPVTSSINDDKDIILSKMKKYDLVHMPITDSCNKIVGLETMRHILERNTYDNPVFLMAGGFGARLKPLTDHTPKPLLKIGSKPILENILDQFIAAGFYNFYISTHYKAEMIQEYFGNGEEWGVSIEYIYENKPLGTAGGLGLLLKKTSNSPVLVMNGDLLTNINFEQLLKFHLEEGGDATMCVREYDFQVPYGVIKSNGSHITSIEEKPVQSFFVNAGMYVLNESILKMVDEISYLDMPQLLEKKIEENGQVNIFPVHEYWLDIGQIENFEQAHKDMS